LLHFTASELVVFSLLLVLSFLTSSGFWRTLGNLAYIYFFPFVLLFYALYFFGRILLALARWFNPRPAGESIELKTPALPALESAQPNSENRAGPSRAKQFALVVSRPVRRFTFVWCTLLLLTTHRTVLWLSLCVVLLHLGRTVLRVLQFTIRAGPWFHKVGSYIRQSTDNVLSKLAAITPESAPSDELRNLWNQVQLFEKGVRFLENEAVLLKWTWLFCASVIVGLYLYLALLFSFAYFGIARVAGSPYSWPESLVTSLFIPFLITDFPRVVALKLLGGLHCALILSVGIGTVINYFRTKLAPIRAVVNVLGVRLSDESVREKRSILEKKLANAGGAGGANNATGSPPATV
jgi:hypothetical protein